MPSFEELCKLFNYTPKGRPLRNAEAAELLGLKPAALDFNRWAGRSPRYIKPEGARFVLYAEPDVLAHLYKGLRNSTSDSGDNVAA
jgi:hypothetical protein